MFHRVVEGSAGSLIFLKVYENTGSIHDATRLAWVVTMAILLVVSILYAYFLEPVLNKVSDRLVKAAVGKKPEAMEMRGAG